MTPLPKRRHSTHRQGKRRQNLELTLKPLHPCPNCGRPTRSHQVCPSCGFYKGKAVIIKKSKTKHKH